MQTAFVVESVERSMKDFTGRLNIGPWFVTVPFIPAAGRYRGMPTDVRLTLAVTFAGHMMLELIEQHDDAPSVYREVVERRGYGFHHWAISTDDLDRAAETYRLRGYQAAFTDISPRGARIAYIDTTRDLPGMIELIEITDSVEQKYDAIYRASADWDGSAPMRAAT